MLGFVDDSTFELTLKGDLGVLESSTVGRVVIERCDGTPGNCLFLDRRGLAGLKMSSDSSEGDHTVGGDLGISIDVELGRRASLGPPLGSNTANLEPSPDRPILGVRMPTLPSSVRLGVPACLVDIRDFSDGDRGTANLFTSSADALIVTSESDLPCPI